MAMYAIKDTTLTALGDAVRNKTGKEKRAYQFDLTSNDPYIPSKSDVIGLSSKYNKLIFDVVEATNVNPNPAYGAFINFTDVNNVLTPFFAWDNGDDPNHIEMNIQYSEIQFLVYGGSVKFNVSIIPIDEDGNEFKYTPLEMAEVINGLEIPDIQPIVLTGDCNYICAGKLAGLYIDNFGDTITTQNITNTKNMFYSNSTKSIPFELNMNIENTSTDTTYMFSMCDYLEQAPIINNLRVYKATHMFNGCSRLRSFPDGFGENWEYSTINNSTQDISYMFNSCYSLRQIPVVLRKNLWNKGTGAYSLYYRGFVNCYTLDEITELYVSSATLTSNSFNNTFNCCYRLKDLIFAVNEDGTPKTANWKKQTIIASSIGFSSLDSYILNYNSGITADKEVKDEATYQALKNNQDWFSCDINYSRYNHDSAVRTINSLPDCSAYLATQTGTSNTNTIKFEGNAGALTDGGAINTLTEEEIAVATAKGWSVALV